MTTIEINGCPVRLIGLHDCDIAGRVRGLNICGFEAEAELDAASGIVLPFCAKPTAARPRKRIGSADIVDFAGWRAYIHPHTQSA